MTGRAAVVTGAASGIGRATVEQFLDSGRYDVVAGLDVDEAVADLDDEFDGFRGFTVDVADHDTVAAVVETIEESAAIHTLVNNAAISEYAWLGDLTPDAWHRVLDVNLTGQYNLAHAVGPLLYEREAGSIVNVSSGAGQRGSASGGVHYSASKAGILGLTKGLAKQLRPHVRVNCVVPGLIDTPLTHDSGLWTEEGIEAFTDRVPLERLGRPEEIAEAIDFLAGPRGSYVTGSVVNVDGGADLI
ncbi:SDR family NAD(P)-dependent oxidoreductase [Halomarina rubra]|uniref:SDR family NAD(P)-dependent oxidoreductase n=1 Tax=Halomarina rubra TaxID=2071873 RepID=A0ABD6AZT5_9EURY|nr:SDR family NAD(P)-dependent oxidoreductase [Halomarina rubra]